MTFPSSRIIFFQIKENIQKLERIVETAWFHFSQKEPFLFFVEDEKSSTFVDDLLWKLPPASFIPHVVTDEPSTDWIVITKGKKNLNQAKYAFNLCSSPLLIEGPFKIIYEFEDLTNPSKKNLSSLRFGAYKQAGRLIEAR